jgi:hypothetical protein
MVALRPRSAGVAAVGSALAIGMSLTTLSFLWSTPGWEPSLGGFPALAVVPGQFLLKGPRHRFASERRRGSSSSRSASPTRLTATTVTMMQKPGIEEIHHARRR